MIYYHVSTDLQHDGFFYPRVPSCRMDEEERETGRISVAPTIADCLSAIPNGGGFLEDSDIERRGYYLIIRIDTDKVGLTDKDIILSDKLYEEDWVRDADFTNEVWVTKSFQVSKEDMFLIHLDFWREDVHDVIPYKLLKVADENYQGDYCAAYEDIYDDLVPSSFTIRDIRFTKQQVEAGQRVELNCEEIDEKEKLIRYIEKEYPTVEIKSSESTLDIHIREACDLRDLFIFHFELVVMYKADL